MSLQLTSSAFASNEKIPLRYSGDGEDVSPPLAWRDLPAGTAELALICDDPDAPTPHPWVHWVIWGLKPQAGELPEHLPPAASCASPSPCARG